MSQHTSPLSKPLTLTVKPLVLTSNFSPLDLFTPLANEPWAMWLDSGQSEHVDACLDILVWRPEVTLCTDGNQTKIHYLNNNTTQSSEVDPLTLLNTVQQQVLTKLAPSQYNLPFLGGALGYFAYDLGRRFEKLPKHSAQDIDLPEMAIGIYSQAVIFDHKKQKFFLICPQDRRLEIEKFLQQKLIKQKSYNAAQQGFHLTSNWQSNMNKASYIEKFEQVQTYLLNGDCYQINLAQRFTADYHGDEFQAYCALRKENQAPFSAFIRLEGAAILSVSPERFLQLSQGKVQSKPIKGTMPRSDDKVQDKQNADRLKHSSKDRAENVMIVDLLRNDIAKVCTPSSVVVPNLFEIESFPAVHHLVSTVEGQLADEYDACDLLRGAFSGGSITGAPKIRAMEIIDQIEPVKRGVYGGAVGYLSWNGNMDTAIAIRTAVIKDGILNIQAGAGVVADSVPRLEWKETLNKGRALFRAVAMAESGLDQ